jgi:hypothetical protein
MLDDARVGATDETTLAVIQPKHRAVRYGRGEAVSRQFGGVEGAPGGRGRLEGGIALVDAGLVDRQGLIGVLGGQGDDEGGCRWRLRRAVRQGQAAADVSRLPMAASTAGSTR